MNKKQQGKDDENLEATSETVDAVTDKIKRPLEGFARFVSTRLTIRSIAKLFVSLFIIVGLTILYYREYFSVFSFKTRTEALYLSTVVLVLFYAAIIIASYWYSLVLRQQHETEYVQYRERIDRIPKLLGTWFLPLASILLVLGTQVASIPSQDNVALGQIHYFLAFNAARLAILLMIGMELSYTAQEHYGNHRWPVLITASLVLDFVSYTLMIIGLKEPTFDAPTGSAVALASAVESEKAFYVAVLGLASLCSSYFTIVKARETDEVLGSWREEGRT